MIPIIRFKEEDKVLQNILSRSQFDFKRVNRVVDDIIDNVKKYQDDAVRRYTMTFDGVEIDDFRVSKADIEKAFDEVDDSLIQYLNKAKANIEAYHEKQMIQPFTMKKDGVEMGQIIQPIDKVGIYVPGGTAAYPSTVLMNAIPAKIAGVKRLVMITPPQKDGSIKPSILVAASIAGIKEIYKLGGAQGIAALAFGTESIPKVDKIVGPGNIYVAMAKKAVLGHVGIDMIAGPSEVLIIADEQQNPDYIAADLMAQAEHDVLASAMLITPSMTLALQVNESIRKQINTLERKEIIETSLTKHGAIIIVKSLDEAVDIANQIAPEHLELMTENPKDLLMKIRHAGSVFLGPYTPEPVGDYVAGPNHTLPTSGTARFSSGLSVLDFIKKTSYVQYDKKALKEDSEAIIGLSKTEGLTAHANSVNIRFKE